ncbi:succinylglutamate desuccinylase/aspartoacylase family protein [Candidatus Gracilibacteria bacterium]|nr:succinylglutamate desuccinylase/aspartoacylase family protein [Candidatus Gracilibacteria bacterium]
MIKKYEYTSLNPGKTILIFGAIHGNETCGPQAIHDIMHEIDIGSIELKSGKIIFVPICNPLAFEQGKRYIDVNLNRIIKKHSKPLLYEEKLANILCDYFDGADVLLDLHSISSEGTPFAFQDYYDNETNAYIKILGVQDIITGWPEMYQGTSDMGTVEYGDTKGVIGTVLECGNHNDIYAAIVAKKAILNTLKHFEIIDGTIEPPSSIRIIEAKYFFKKTKAGVLVKIWNHLDPVKKGETIAIYEDGEIIRANEDGYILLPFMEAPIGAEWFYFGKG